MIRIAKPEQAPRILRNHDSRGPKETRLLIEQYQAGKRKFEFKSSIYAAKSVKQALIKAQFGKCCFCEAMILHIAYGDVEHFRPKGGFKQKAKDKLSEPGYYWLAYDWNNLLLSCTLCNRRHKGNLFPLFDPRLRVTSHADDIAQEQPVYIHPALDDPQDYVSFRQEIAFGLDSQKRGARTLESLGINREALAERRRDHLARLLLARRTILVLSRLRNKQGGLSSELSELLRENELALEKSVLPNAEYSSMAQAALG